MRAQDRLPGETDEEFSLRKKHADLANGFNGKTALRDELAKAAMIELINRNSKTYVETAREDIARISYLMSDAMMKARDE